MEKEETMKDIIAKVQQWCIDSGLDRTDPLVQYVDLVENTSELGNSIISGDYIDQEFAVGKIMLSLTVICMQTDIIDIENCLIFAADWDYPFLYNFRDSIKRIKDTGKGSYKTPLEIFPSMLSSLNFLGASLTKFPDGEPRKACLVSAVGDILILLIKISESLDLSDIDDCYWAAFEEIKENPDQLHLKTDIEKEKRMSL